jgi:hypothetical protein
LLARQLDDHQLGYLGPFHQNSGFNASERYEHEFPHSPNRHAIMHGRDCNYGTRLNYLKALSLLNLVALIVPDIVDDPHASTPAARPA